MIDQVRRKVLLRAAELVERGWCQGTLGMKAVDQAHAVGDPLLDRPYRHLGHLSIQDQLVAADRLCLDGAVMLAIHEVTGQDLTAVTQSSFYRAAREALKAALPSWTSYVSWNDMAGRTAEEVAALCRKAAGDRRQRKAAE